MINEMTSMSCTVTPNGKYIETNDSSGKRSLNKHNKV